MTRLLHTADVHLAADAPERREALAAVLEAGERADVDVVTVGGDLFDSERDAERLRPELRGLFSDRPFDVVTIPGNHDAAAFGSDLHYGESFEAAVTEPFEHHDVPGTDLRVTCVPYTDGNVEDVLLALAERDPFDGSEALLVHCSLEAPFADASEGDEGGRQYFPVTRAALADLGFDYCLAGHYHSAHRLELDGGGAFVYPGTPASVTRSETGPRNVALVDTDADRVEFRRLESFHYDALDVSVAPGEEAAALEEIAAWVDERSDRNVEAEITVTGHVERPETDFQRDLEDASGDVPLTNRTTGVADILAHPLFESFEERLAAREFDDEALEREVRTRALRVFSALSTGGRLS